MVRERGARLTLPRLHVLAQLLGAGEALSHREVQRRVQLDPAMRRVDRVTVYRVLDWLVSSGLAHRVPGPDRVYRFSAPPGRQAALGHFRCTRCERMFRLDETAGLARLARALLPPEFTGERIELTVAGCCAGCAAAWSAGAAVAQAVTE